MAPSLPFTKNSSISARNLLFGKGKKRASATSQPAAEGENSSSSTTSVTNNEQPLIPNWSKIQQQQQQQNDVQPSIKSMVSEDTISTPPAAGGDSAANSQTQLTQQQQPLPSALRDSNNNTNVSNAAETRRSLAGVSFARELDDERIIPSRNTPAYLREQQQQGGGQNSSVINKQHFRYDADGPLQAMHENSISAVAIVHKTLSTTTLKDTRQQQQLDVLTPESVPLREYSSSSLMPTKKSPSPSPQQPPTPTQPTHTGGATQRAFSTDMVRFSSTERSPSTELRISTAIEHRSSSFVDGEEPPTRWSVRTSDAAAADVPTLKASNSTSMSALVKKSTISRDSGLNDNQAKGRPPSTLQIPPKSSAKNSNSSSTHTLPDLNTSTLSSAGGGPTVTYMMNEPRNSSTDNNNNNNNSERASSSPQARGRQHQQHRTKKTATTSSGGTSTTAEGLQTDDIGLISDGTGNDSPATKKYRTLAPSTVMQRQTTVDGQQVAAADDDDAHSSRLASPSRPIKSGFSATAIANDRIKESIMALYVDRRQQQANSGSNKSPLRQQQSRSNTDKNERRVTDVDFVVQNDDDDLTNGHDVDLPQTLRSEAALLRPSLGGGGGGGTSRKASAVFRSASVTRSAPHAPTSTVVPAAEDEDDDVNEVNSSPPEPAPRLSRTNANNLHNTNNAAEQRLSTAWAADSIRRIFSSHRESRDYEEVVGPADQIVQARPLSAARSKDERLRKANLPSADESSLSNLSLTTSADEEEKQRGNSSRNRSQQRAVRSPNEAQNLQTLENQQQQQQQQNDRLDVRKNSSSSSFRTTESDMGKRYVTALLNDCPKEFRPIEGNYVVQRFVRDEDLIQQAVTANNNTAQNADENANNSDAAKQQQKSLSALSTTALSHRSSAKSNHSTPSTTITARAGAPVLTTTPASNVQIQIQQQHAAAASRAVVANIGGGGQPVYLAGSSALNALNHNNDESNVSNSGSNAVSNRLAALDTRGSSAGTGTLANSNRTNMSYASSSTLGISATTTTEPANQKTTPTTTTTTGAVLLLAARSGGAVSQNGGGTISQYNRQNSQRTNNNDECGEEIFNNNNFDDTQTIISNNNNNNNHDEQSFADEQTNQFDEDEYDDDETRTETAETEYDEEMLRSLADARQISHARFPTTQQLAVVAQSTISNNKSKSSKNSSSANLRSEHNNNNNNNNNNSHTSSARHVPSPAALAAAQNNAAAFQASHTREPAHSHAGSSGGGGAAFRDTQQTQQQQQQQQQQLLAEIITSANPSYRDLQVERLNELVSMNQTLSDAAVNDIVLAANKSLPPASSAAASQSNSKTRRAISKKSLRNNNNNDAMSSSQEQQNPTKSFSASNLIVPSSNRRTPNSPAKSDANMRGAAAAAAVDQPLLQPQHKSLSNIKILSQSNSKQQQQQQQLSQQQLLVYNQTSMQSRSCNAMPRNATHDAADAVAAEDDDDNDNDGIIPFKEVGSGDFNQMIENLHQQQQQQQQQQAHMTYSSSLAKTRMQSISNAAASTAGNSPQSGRSKASLRAAGGTRGNVANVRSVASTDANHQHTRSEHVLPTATTTSRQRLIVGGTVSDKQLSQQHQRQQAVVHAAASAYSSSRTPFAAGGAANLPHSLPQVSFKPQTTTAHVRSQNSSRTHVLQRNLSNTQQHESENDALLLLPANNVIPTITNAKRSSDSDESVEFEAKKSRTLLGVLDSSRRRRRRVDDAENSQPQEEENFLSPFQYEAEPQLPVNDYTPSRINFDPTSSALKAAPSSTATNAENARRILGMLRPPGLLRTSHTVDEQLNILHDLHSMSPTENVVSHALLEHANANSAFGSRIYPQPKLRVPFDALQLSSSTVARLLEASTGGEVYLLGVERFSEQNVSDVRDLIEQTQPDIVFVQLGADIASARSRRSVTSVQDPSGQTVSELYLKESSPPWLPGSWRSVLRPTIERHGFINGFLHLLFLDLESSYTRRHAQPAQMAFREAVALGDAAPFCDVVFGDRARDVTFCRAYMTLNFFEKLYLMCRLVFAHMHGDSYAALTSLAKTRRVLVDERDKIMCASLQYYAQALLRTSEGMRPLTIAAVVSAEHINGIKHYWRHTLDVRPLQKMPAQPYGSDEVVLRKLAYWTPWVVLGTVGLYAGCKAVRYAAPIFKDFYSSFAAR